MANWGGKKGNKNGKFARNGFAIDWSQFEEFAEELDGLGADLKEIFTDVMQQTAETVQEDTAEATQKAYLPAQGRYSQEDTIKAIVQYPKVNWSGTLGSIGLGFDKTKPNAGTFLITGTPRVRPDYKLEDIYARKKYLKGMITDINDYFMDTLDYIAQRKG